MPGVRGQTVRTLHDIRGDQYTRREAFPPRHNVPMGFPSAAVTQPPYHLPPLPVKGNAALMENSNELLWREIRKQGEIYTPRFDHSTIRRGDQVYLFGGSTANFYTVDQFLNDLFVFDTITGLWTRISPQSTSPSPRAGQSMVMYKNKRFHMFGGRSEEGLLNDLWIFDLRLNIWGLKRASGVPPTPRSHHRACLWNDAMLIYGGAADDDEGCVWSLDLVSRTWSRKLAKGPRPPNRSGHEAIVVEQHLYIFGGQHLSGSQTGEASNDLWRVDLSKSPLAWEKLACEGEEPTARHGMAGVRIGSRWVLQGGRERIEDDVVSQTDTAVAFNFNLSKWQPLPESLVPFCQASRWGHRLNLIRTKTGSHCILLTGGVTLCKLPLH
ncbi:MAG: hypothetical protein KVP17_001399 [Porospora cf. gigantea B]|nr:MAG: hypothetical protein KVP17_001399 [Porospora cf. gigantea B]